MSDPVADVNDSAAQAKKSERPDKAGVRVLGKVPRYVWYILTFLGGGAAVLAARYLFRGTTVQLTPEAFVSLVFTVAVGAASLILAILAINYGRVSERVMTERADRSIDIQMSLFQKSLDLQTQLFDKTMSTLESIGRSTGVTEQRLSDIHSLMQNPAILKQVAGRAVEQTTSELSKSGKEVPKQDQLEPQMAERLTKNIVRELSAQFEALGPMLQAARPPAARPPSEQQTAKARLLDSVNELKRQADLARRRQELHAAVEKAVAAIPEVRAQGAPTEAGMFWDYLLTYKGRKLAVDLRTSRGPKSGDVSPYGESIELLLKRGLADNLLFVFAEPPISTITEYFALVGDAFPGKVYFVATTDHRVLEAQVRAILEKPPAASVQSIRQEA